MFKALFGFGQTADLDIVLDGADSRKMSEIKTEEGKKERYYVFYDGESVSGKVCNVFISIFHSFIVDTGLTLILT